MIKYFLLQTAKNEVKNIKSNAMDNFAMNFVSTGFVTRHVHFK